MYTVVLPGKADHVFVEVTFVKQLIGKNSKVHEALEKLDKLTAQEGQAVAIATFFATNQVLQLFQGQVFQLRDICWFFLVLKKKKLLIKTFSKRQRGTQVGC